MMNLSVAGSTILALTSNITTPAVRNVTRRQMKIDTGYAANELFHQAVNVYMLPVLMIVGLVANTLIILVMRHKWFQRLPLRVYMVSLAVSDTLALLVVGVDKCTRHAFGLILSRGQTICFTWGVFYNFFPTLSAWLIVCIAIERVIVVIFPTKAKRFPSPKKAKITVGFIATAIGLLSTINLWMMDLSISKCIYLDQYTHFHKYGKGTMDLIVNRLLPFTLIAVSYSVVVRAVIGSRRKTTGVTSDTNNQPTVNRLTNTALIICLAFLLLTLPGDIISVLKRVYGWKMSAPPEVRVMESLGKFLTVLNYSINFFLNLGTNTQFRLASIGIFTRSTVVFPSSSNS